MSSPSIAETAAFPRRKQKLAASPELFELGTLSAAATDDSFIRRLNTIVAQRREDMLKTIPATFAEAIKTDGELKKHAELVVFGRWLLLDGHPGMGKQRGQQIVPRTVLKCVAAILAEIYTPSLRRGRKNRKSEVTTHDVAAKWQNLFKEPVTPSMFDARFRSVKRILPRYLEHLKSGGATHAGKRIRKSPEIQRALDAISGMLPTSQVVRPAILTEPDVKHPAALVPFEIELGYQSDAHKADYRKPHAARHIASHLRYSPTVISSTATSGKIRADRAGKIVLLPDMHIRRDYTTTAVIDRLAILIETVKGIEASRLQRLILNRTGASTFVHDLRKRLSKDVEWGAPFMELDHSKLVGIPYAILIQDPTPDVLAAIVKAIEDGPGIVGPILLHLIEVSVDFFAKKPSTPEDAIMRREQMVGLMQRHHWVPHQLLLNYEPTRLRDVDARQIHDDAEHLSKRKPKTRYLFAYEKMHGIRDKIATDANISTQSIRDRVLTTRPGTSLFLNSTLVKGGKYAPFQISIQHKIADRRDRKKQTLIELAPADRRARVEVTISGSETLKDRGLATIDDLASISFRTLTRKLLSFKLGMVEPWQHLMEDAVAQMRTRGVYGIDLRTRALDLERRDALRRSCSKPPRKTDREGMALHDWQEMNDVVGTALDELQRRWRRFTTS